jgi:hypothetical protein
MSDRAGGKKCILPTSVPDVNAYRGYMDGWSGREFSEPVAKKIVLFGREINETR